MHVVFTPDEWTRKRWAKRTIGQTGPDELHSALVIQNTLRQNPLAQASYAIPDRMHTRAKVTLSARRTTAISTDAWATHTSPFHTLSSCSHTADTLPCRTGMDGDPTV